MKKKFNIEILNVFIAGACTATALNCFATGDVGKAFLGLFISVLNILMFMYYGGK